MDCYRNPSAIESAIGTPPLYRQMSHHAHVGVLNRLVLNRFLVAQPRDSCTLRLTFNICLATSTLSSPTSSWEFFGGIVLDLAGLSLFDAKQSIRAYKGVLKAPVYSEKRLVSVYLKLTWM